MSLFKILASFWIINFVSCQVSDEAKELTLKWAPMIWLHSEEKFFPVNPQFVIGNMEVCCIINYKY